MGDTVPLLRDYAGHLGVSTDKVFELRKAVCDLCGVRNGGTTDVENLSSAIAAVVSDSADGDFEFVGDALIAHTPVMQLTD